MDSFRYILYVYKRTILRASGREKDKKTRCGSARRSNGTTGGSKTHNHAYGIVFGTAYGMTVLSDSRESPQIGIVDYSLTVGNRIRRQGIPPINTTRIGFADTVYGSYGENKQLNLRTSEGLTRETSSMEPYVAVYVWRRTA